MIQIRAKSKAADSAYALVTLLQRRLVEKLETIAEEKTFVPIEWFRDKGRHGGGIRYEARDSALFNAASVNVSQVHYDDSPARKLASATALSAIIHPKDPHTPSVHIHISWTEMRDGHGYWRLMADLNPAIEHVEETLKYSICLQAAAGGQYDEASAQGDRYFYIPALDRHRGVTHFYLEEYNSGDAEYDLFLAEIVGNAAIDCYANQVISAIKADRPVSDEDRKRQLDYHTLYLFQVLTLDRGTTSGLLIHDQNDVGILGSLPTYVDRELLVSWLERMSPPQDILLRQIIEALPDTSPSKVDEATKLRLAKVVREHYRAHPEALSMQASGNTIPSTVKNHSDQ